TPARMPSPRVSRGGSNHRAQMRSPHMAAGSITWRRLEAPLSPGPVSACTLEGAVLRPSRLPMSSTRKAVLFVLAACLGAVAVLAQTACGSAAKLSVAQGMGPHPALPPPDHSLIPLVNVVTAKGWAPNQAPVAAEGTNVTRFASGLQHPRWVYVLPNGDVLVAETNAPVRPKDARGIKGKFFKHFQKKAG